MSVLIYKGGECDGWECSWTQTCGDNLKCAKMLLKSEGSCYKNRVTRFRLYRDSDTFVKRRSWVQVPELASILLNFVLK